ncbi:MAG: DUF1064 domain-containing protein [Erysipelotrichaceae bacterium]|nr:DUF1064 domain-containing protein [Erysipelotrichaceae bacterium]
MMINYPNGHKPITVKTSLKQAKKSKYRAIKTETDGIMFDSKHEAARYQELRLLEQVGEIENLRLQVPYELIAKSKYGRSIKYVADFVYERNGLTVVEDAKGVRTPVYRFKKRMMAEKYGIKIEEV